MDANTSPVGRKSAAPSATPAQDHKRHRPSYRIMELADGGAPFRPTLLRTVLAFAVAPLAPGLVSWLFVVLMHDGHAESIWASQLLSEMLAASAFLGYPAAFLVGLPAYIFAITFRIRNTWLFALTFLVLGCVPPVQMIFLLHFEIIRIPMEFAIVATWSGLVVCALCAAVGCLAFWLIARPLRSCTVKGG